MGGGPRREVHEHLVGGRALTRRHAALEFAKVLVLSTGHLGAAIATGDDPLMNTVASMTGEHGWLVYVGAHLPVVTDEPAAVQVLRDVLHFAKQRGCAYVLFDTDGPTLSQFPTYEW